jgi:DNA-binding LytR/AlgR family response regulator
VESVREVQNWFSGDLVAILTDGTRVTVSRTHREQFLAALEG